MTRLDPGVVQGGRHDRAGTRHRDRGVWRQIAEYLRADVETQRFAPGARLPTEAELARRFAVNRHTVRRAIADLEERGWVQVRQGSGTFASTELIDYPLSDRTRFSENVRHNRRAPGGRLLGSQRMAAEDPVARALGLPPGAPVVHLETLRTADGMAISVASSYFPLDRFDGLPEAVARHGAVTPALAEFGVDDYTRLQTRVTARLAGRRHARLLGIGESDPVLIADAVNVDRDAHPIEASQSRYAAERIQLTIEN